MKVYYIPVTRENLTLLSQTFSFEGHSSFHTAGGGGATDSTTGNTAGFTIVHALNGGFTQSQNDGLGGGDLWTVSGGTTWSASTAQGQPITSGTWGITQMDYFAPVTTGETYELVGTMTTTASSTFDSSLDTDNTYTFSEVVSVLTTSSHTIWGSTESILPWENEAISYQTLIFADPGEVLAVYTGDLLSEGTIWIDTAHGWITQSGGEPLTSYLFSTTPSTVSAQTAVQIDESSVLVSSTLTIHDTSWSMTYNVTEEVGGGSYKVVELLTGETDAETTTATDFPSTSLGSSQYGTAPNDTVIVTEFYGPETYSFALSIPAVTVREEYYSEISGTNVSIQTMNALCTTRTEVVVGSASETVLTASFTDSGSGTLIGGPDSAGNTYVEVESSAETNATLAGATYNFVFFGRQRNYDPEATVDGALAIVGISTNKDPFQMIPLINGGYQPYGSHGETQQVFKSLEPSSAETGNTHGVGRLGAVLVPIDATTTQSGDGVQTDSWTSIRESAALPGDSVNVLDNGSYGNRNATGAYPFGGAFMVETDAEASDAALHATKWQTVNTTANASRVLIETFPISRWFSDSFQETYDIDGVIPNPRTDGDFTLRCRAVPIFYNDTSSAAYVVLPPLTS